MSKKGIEWFAGTAANLRAYTYQYLRLIRIGNPKDESDLAVLSHAPSLGAQGASLKLPVVVTVRSSRLQSSSKGIQYDTKLASGPWEPRQNFPSVRLFRENFPRQTASSKTSPSSLILLSPPRSTFTLSQHG